MLVQNSHFSFLKQDNEYLIFVKKVDKWPAVFQIPGIICFIVRTPKGKHMLWFGTKWTGWRLKELGYQSTFSHTLAKK